MGQKGTFSWTIADLIAGHGGIAALTGAAILAVTVTVTDSTALRQRTFTKETQSRSLPLITIEYYSPVLLTTAHHY